MKFLKYFLRKPSKIRISRCAIPFWSDIKSVHDHISRKSAANPGLYDILCIRYSLWTSCGLYSFPAKLSLLTIF